MRLAIFIQSVCVVTALLGFASPAVAQSGSTIVKAESDPVIVEPAEFLRTFSVTVDKADAPNDGVDVEITVVDGVGNVVQTYTLSGDGDGTGVRNLPAGHAVHATVDGKPTRISFDVVNPSPPLAE